MVTTIQVNEQTLALLKKLKGEVHASTYEEAIRKVVVERTKKKSIAGSLKKYMGKQSLHDLLKDLRDKHDRM